MGVYIKGKRKPGTCYDCDFVDGSDDCFFGLGYTGDMCDCVYEDCPLIEVIEPHGRLIDADVCKQRVYDGSRTPYKTCPTVIEAEGE